MKILLALLVAACALSVLADSPLPLNCTIALTGIVQTRGYQSAAITNVPAPGKFSVNTKSLLAQLAQVEFFQGHYTHGAFPLGSRLFLSLNMTNFEQSKFQVVDTQGLLIVDVSDVMTFTAPNGYGVISGYGNTVTDVNPSLTQILTGVISYDDTGTALPGTKNQWSLQCLIKFTEKDTPIKNGFSTRKAGIALTGFGIGNVVGVVDTEPSIITGKAAMTGSVTFAASP